MSTPIYDFLKKYSENAPTRLHMPGHKGRGPLGVCALDLTEINGADSLYSPDGIILESEKNASQLYGSHTYYSTEGSSLAIRAMLHLACLHARASGRRPKILAVRNAHRVFISAAALLDFEVEWLACRDASYLSCRIDTDELRERLASADELPCAVYLTSPDYLGFISDIKKIAEVCHEFGVLLLVDNAHGAYLKFLSSSLHPIDLGADMCCDSAHKTLGALTGAAYLHISSSTPSYLSENAKDAMLLFGSTSPSYLILASLDLLNDSISSLSELEKRASMLRDKISALGYEAVGDEPLKITIAAKSYGYLGQQIGSMLEERGIYPEFADPDYVVFMISEHNSDSELDSLVMALASIERRAPIQDAPPAYGIPERYCSVREALLAACESVDTECSVGRVMADSSVSCPPAVPIAVSGEIIDEATLSCFRYYGIKRVKVIKEQS